jgi:hypothetical protein
MRNVMIADALHSQKNIVWEINEAEVGSDVVGTFRVRLANATTTSATT